MASLVGALNMELPLSDFRRMEVEEFDTTKLLAHASQQARERGYKNFPIVDVDSHHYENEAYREIVEYIEDPVLQQLAQSVAAGQRQERRRCLPAASAIRTWPGAITRYATRGMEKTPPGKQRDVALDAALDGRHGHRRRGAVPDADAATRPASAGRGRSGAGARL